MQKIVSMLEEIFPNHKVRHEGNVAKVTTEEVTLLDMLLLVHKSSDKFFPLFTAKVRRSGTQVTLIVTAS